MVDVLFMDKMNEKIERMQTRLRTIDNLIKAGEIRAHGDVLTADKQVMLQTIYGEDSTVTVGEFGLVGGRVSDHIHEGVAQFIVCVKGSFNIVTSKWARVIHPSDCASIPKDVTHSVTALENDSKLIAVCVPEEGNYVKSMGNNTR